MTHKSARKSAHICAALLLLVPLSANAQEWPAKQPIKIIVPFTAGSATDITARTVFEQVGKQIGQSFVVENRGGAGTSLGMGMAAKADPDGYTLLVNSASHVVVASTYPNLSFSVADDLAAVTQLASIPFVIAANPRHKSVKDMIETGKKPGSAILYGTAGAGSSGHLFMELYRITGGFPATHVPFRGTPEGMTEVIAGRIDMYPAPAVNAIQLGKDGKVNSLAVSSNKRLLLMPEVPTMAEVGLPKAEYNFWVGAFVPAKTPKPIIDRLNREIVAALKVKEIADKIVALGGDPAPMSPSEFDAFVRKEIAINAEIVKASGIPKN